MMGRVSLPGRERMASPWMKSGAGRPMSPDHPHRHSHAFASLHALEREGLVVASRRNMLKASLAGLCGLSLADVLRLRSMAAGTETARAVPTGKAVILLWMAGGPSQID